MKISIYNLNTCPTNERNGTYGGQAGDKEGITINDKYWIVKYPKTTRGMRGDLLSYTTAPLSEYLGSNIYQILGIDTHDTILGIRNDKLVVACKDFCAVEGSLREIRTLKNIYNKELSEKLEAALSSTSAYAVDLNDMLIHLEYNPILKSLPDIKKRFWEQIIVDVLINNSDRNNGNWGLLYENGEYSLAPVFDNGGSFMNKTLDEKLEASLQNSKGLQQVINSSRTVYELNGKTLFAKNIMQYENEDFFKALIKTVPTIAGKMNEIKDFINSVPERCEGLSVCSDVRKRFYIQTMEMKLEQLLLPAFENAEKQLGIGNGDEDKTEKPKKNNKTDYSDV